MKKLIIIPILLIGFLTFSQIKPTTRIKQNLAKTDKLKVFPNLERYQLKQLKDKVNSTSNIGTKELLSPEIIKELNSYDIKDMKIYPLRPKHGSLSMSWFEGEYSPEAFVLHPRNSGRTSYYTYSAVLNMQVKRDKNYILKIQVKNLRETGSVLVNDTKFRLSNTNREVLYAFSSNYNGPAQIAISPLSYDTGNPKELQITSISLEEI